MRILITTGIFSPEIGGPASYAENLAGELVNAGHQVTVIAYSSVIKSDGDQSRQFKIVRIWEKIPRPFRHGMYYLKTLALAKSHDVIYTLNAVSAGLPSLWAAFRTKKKFFVKVVGDYAWEMAIQENKTSLMLNDFQESAKSGRINKLAQIQAKVCRQADGVITPSNYLAEIIKGWDVPADKIHVIYNGVEPFSGTMSKEEARKKIGISGAIILSAGRFVPWKGFKMLIKIMPKLLEINQFFRLIIIGDGPEGPLLKQMVKNMNLDKKVYLVGKKSRQEMSSYLSAADLFVLNSGYEGFSHQLLEALAAGVPVIASAVGGNRELVKQGHNGFLVKYNDEFNLIEAIKGLHGLPEVQEQFSQEGKKTASEYTAQKMFEETLKVLRQ